MTRDLLTDRETARILGKKINTLYKTVDFFDSNDEDEWDLVEGEHYPIEVAEEYFDKDFNIAVKGAEELIGEISLNFIQKCCIIQMVYQLGKPRTSKFKKMWEALKKQDYSEASFQMMDSRWAKQTPSRAKSLSQIMRSCKA